MALTKKRTVQYPNLGDNEFEEPIIKKTLK